MLRALFALPRTVWLIGLISLVNDSASEMLYPLIPLFLSSVLMAGPRALGLMEGVAEATASILKLFSGAMMDRTGRARPFMVLGYSMGAVGRPLVALVTSWPALMAIRFADRVGKGLRSSPRDALLAASAGPEHRGLAFGLHRAMDNAGAVVGPLLASALLGLGVPLRDLFVGSVVPGAVCVLLALGVQEPATHVPAPAPRDWTLRDMPAGFTRYLWVVALFTLGNSSNMFLLLHASALGLPAAQVPVLWAVVQAVAMVFSAPLSALSDRLGRRRLLVGGWAAYAGVYAALGQLTSAGPALWGLMGTYGLFLAATEGVEKALVADLAPEGRRGSAFGWFNLTAGVAVLPASLMFGALYQGVAPWAAFALAGACALGAAVLLMVWVPAPASSGR
jgi:MFS family permease